MLLGETGIGTESTSATRVSSIYLGQIAEFVRCVAGNRLNPNEVFAIAPKLSKTKYSSVAVSGMIVLLFCTSKNVFMLFFNVISIVQVCFT